MEIKTNYNIGDEVIFYHAMRMRDGKIIKIKAEKQTNSGIEIYYTIDCGDKVIEVNQMAVYNYSGITATARKV